MHHFATIIQHSIIQLPLHEIDRHLTSSTANYIKNNTKKRPDTTPMVASFTYMPLLLDTCS